MKKIPAKAIEFHPDALEIKYEKLPLWARWSVWSALLFLLAALLWAWFGRVDVIVQAKGKLVSDKPNIVMKPLERTVIQEIHVKIGDVVKKDQVLFTFDPTINIAESERLRHELSALEAQFNRLQAEFSDAPLKLAGESRFEQLQQASYRQRQEFFKEKLNYYNEAIKQIDASKKAKEDNLVKQRERLEAIRRIEDMFVKLHEQKATSLKELLQISISRMEMEAGIDTIENSLLELGHQRESTVAAMNSFVQEWRNGIVEELVKVERELSSTQKQLEKSENLVSFVNLRAPCDAVVHEIAAFSAGSAVREAEALVTLIALDGKMELEAEIRPQDIGKVGIGSEARVKLDAYPFQKHGTLNGTVRNLSEDTLQREARQGGEAPATYYRARIIVTGNLRQVSSNFRLIPGMEAQAEIKTGRRRIIEYLTYPLIKALDETAREP